MNIIRSLINDKDAFNYKVQVNGVDAKSITVVGGTSAYGSAPSARAMSHDGLYDMSPTYFNATYTLAKK